MRFLKIALATLACLFCTSVALGQTRYVMGPNSMADSSGHIFAPVPASVITGTNTQSNCAANNTALTGIYKQQKVGAYTLTIPEPSGQYTVNMYFAEPCGGYQVGWRVFNVSVDGAVVLPKFDMVATAGGVSKPIVKTGSYTIPNTASSSAIVIQFTAVTNNPIFAAVEILPVAVVSPPVITGQPANIGVTAGGAGFFRVVASGNGLTYQWQKNGVNITGANNPSYTTPPAVQADSGASFTCVVSNSAGSVTSTAGVMTVNPIVGHLDNGLTTLSTWVPTDVPLGQCGFNFTCTTTFTAPPNSTNATLNITIVTGLTPLVITTTSLPPGTLNQPYSATLTATGGQPPYTWSVSAGALPLQLSLNPQTGVISGTPTVAGMDTFTATVTDSSIPAMKTNKTLSIDPLKREKK